MPDIEIKWVKIATGIADDEKIKFIFGMPEGEAIFSIWILLICLAGKCNDNGNIHMSGIPYTEETIATVLNKKVPIVRLALTTFDKLNMVSWKPGEELFLYKFEEHQNIEGMEKVRTLNAARARKFYYKNKQPQQLQPNVRLTLSHATDIDIDIEKEEERDRENIKEKTNNGVVDKNVTELWEKVKVELKEKINAANFKTYFEKLEPVDLNDGFITLAVPNNFIADFIEQNQKSLINQILTEVAGRPLSFQCVLKESG